MGDIKKINRLMEELGFNQKATTSSKAAFIKYLAKAAYGVDLKIPPLYDEKNSNHNVDSILKPSPAEQMELPFEANKKEII